MIKLIHNQKLSRVLKTIRPWLTAIVLVLILRYTGILSGITFLTNSALIRSGIMDIDPGNKSAHASFDYNFTIKDLQGNRIDMNQFKGKVIFLNMWATWCGPCRVEMPCIQALYEKLDHDKIIFVMLSLDTDENRQKIVRYIDEKGFTFPVYQPSGSMPKQLQVSSIPTTFIISPEGKIEMKKVGTANYDTE